MKKLLFALLLIVSGQCFAQGDTITPEILNWARQGFKEVSPVPMPLTIPGTTSPGSFQWPDCGTPVPYEEISDWKTVDTLGDYYSHKQDFAFLAKNLYEWVEDEWRTDNTWLTYTTLELDPCKTLSTMYTQYRIHKVTGIRQIRTKLKGTRYEPKPKSEYEQTVEKFTKKPNT